MADLAALLEGIKSALGSAVTGAGLARGELTIEVGAPDILKTMAYLQGPGEFKILVDLCGVDWPQRAKRFDVVYHLLSLTKMRACASRRRWARGRAFPPLSLS